MTDTADDPKTIAFKVDLLFKVVVVGMLAFAGRLSWKAWEDTQDTLKYALEQIGHHETRISVNERDILRNAKDLDYTRPRK